MSESFQTWQNVLLQWVNCLGLQEKRVQSVKDLGDGRFFANLLKTLLDMPTSDMTTDQANEDITSFLKSSYPNYGMAAESCEVEDEIEIMYITSLLLFHSVVQCKCEKIVTCMYTLNQDVQCYITHFLNSVSEEGNITRDIIQNSIYSYRPPGTVVVECSTLQQINEMNAVQRLELVCAPKYQLVDIQAPLHRPTFKFSVTVGNVVGSAPDELLPPLERMLEAHELGSLKDSSSFQYLLKVGYEHVRRTLQMT